MCDETGSLYPANGGFVAANADFVAPKLPPVLAAGKVKVVAAKCTFAVAKTFLAANAHIL